ncbi:putative fimbrial protein TcfA [Vibrio crassostreae]|nr:putative fimbrial protein TcfA [Vibrio crassostreae]
MNIIVYFLILFSFSSLAKDDDVIQGRVQLSTDTLTVDFPLDSEWESKLITNDGEMPAFVLSSVLELKNPGETEELLEEVSYQNAPVIIPDKIVIPAKSSKRVKFVLPKTYKKDKDRVFRISFSPVTPKVEDGFELSKLDLEQYTTSGLTLNVGIGFLVIVPRSDPQPDLKVAINQDGQLSFDNIGNTLIHIKEMEICREDGDCKVFPLSKRLVSGAKWFFDDDLIDLNNSIKIKTKELDTMSI